MQKAKSIKEIAELAGVSAATVSRIINKNGRFSRETEERVLHVIQQNDYVPNSNARGLRTSRARVIGIVVPDITNPHFANLVLDLEMRLFQQGYSCLICNTNESQELEKKHIQSLVAQTVSGMVLISGTRNYAELEDIPVVYVDRPAHTFVRSLENASVMIESDNQKGGYLATRELLDAGCRRIAILKCLTSEDDNQLARYRGYQQALKEYGLPLERELLLDQKAVSTRIARAAILGLLDSGTQFDGIMATTDTMAAGAVLALRERGLYVPEDVLVTGFDDSALAEVCGPGLTSVRQDVGQMAELSADLILQMIEGKTPERFYYRLPVSLVRRGSTKIVRQQAAMME